ncbi:atp-dependent rna helicase dhx8, partial [Moniliophthora roreri MCA 2997]
MQESESYIGVNDKVLAEFVIDLHGQSNKSLSELQAFGADFPDSFVENVDRLILSLHPKHKKKLATNGEVAAKGDGELTEEERKRQMFPGLALKDQEVEPKRPSELERSPKRQRTERSPPRRRSPSPPRGGRGHDDRRGRSSRPALDDSPILFKIYNGRISGLKEFGAFVQLEGVAGRVEGMVHVSNIQTGTRVNSASDLLSKGQNVKVKVISVAGNRIGLFMKDVDQVSGRDLTPHPRIKSEAEMEEEQRHAARASMSGANAVLLNSKDEGPKRSAKRLTSPEQYPDLMHNFMVRAEVEVEIREGEPPFLAGQTKRTLDLNPVKIVKAPDGSQPSGTGWSRSVESCDSRKQTNKQIRKLEIS